MGLSQTSYTLIEYGFAACLFSVAGLVLTVAIHIPIWAWIDKRWKLDESSDDALLNGAAIACLTCGGPVIAVCDLCAAKAARLLMDDNGTKS